MKKIFVYLAPVLAFPFTASAAAATDLKSLMNILMGLLGQLMTLFYAAAFVAFFYGIAKYIMNPDDINKNNEGKKWMMWAVISLFVMVTVWGIVGLLTRTFGLSSVIIPQM